ncbi:unknown [Bacteroides sp. CAG:754]|nr:unknown [Bacteroides sp. CAG:754]
MSDSYGLARLYANTQLSVSGLCILCDAVIGLD